MRSPSLSDQPTSNGIKLNYHNGVKVTLVDMVHNTSNFVYIYYDNNFQLIIKTLGWFKLISKIKAISI